MSEPGSTSPLAPARPPSGLRAAWLLARRELTGAFDSAVGTVTLAAFVLATTTVYLNEFFLIGRLDLAPFFARLPLFLILLAPALAMRTWAEERRARTFELLVTLPVSGLVLAAGKLLAAWALLCLALLGTTPLVGLLLSLGEPDLGVILSGYLGATLLGLALVSVGSLVSALTRDQVVAFAGSALLAALLLGTGEPRVAAVLDGLAPELGPGSWLRETFSLLPAYEHLVAGRLELASLLQLGGTSLLALALHPLALREGRA